MFPQFKTILVASDFSPTSDHALEYARALARSFGSTLHLLHVVPSPVMAAVWSEAYAYDLGAFGERLRREAERQLTGKAQTIRDVTVTTEALVGNPAAIIAVTAARRAVDLIVIGTHGRTGVPHLFMGSVAERVVRSSPCPVLTVRGPIGATEERPLAEVHAVSA